MGTTCARLFGATVVALALPGCSGDEPRACTAEIAGECVGLPQEPFCGGDVCTEGASCAQELEATNDGEVADAVGRSAPGDCIALAPGQYAAIQLPPGVSLLGRDADDVHVAGLTVGPGSGALVRGLEVSGGIDIGSATGVRIEGVRVAGSLHGILARAGSSMSVSRSEVLGATRVGVYAVAATNITIDASIVADAAEGGVRIVCDGSGSGCACATKTSATLTRVLARHNSIIGLALEGTVASLDRVDIRDDPTRDFSGPAAFAATAGLSVAGCSQLTYGSVSVAGMEKGYGVLFDSSSAGPGMGFGEVGIVVIDTRIGIWGQRIGAMGGQSLTIQGADVREVRGTGIGFDRGAVGIVVIDTRVENVANEYIPAEVDGVPASSAEIGVGVIWKGASSASLDGITVSGTAGQAVLIDGPVGTNSSIANLSLAGGDEGDGVVQQGVGAMDLAPATDGSVQLNQQATLLFDVPLGPEPPAALPMQ